MAADLDTKTYIFISKYNYDSCGIKLDSNVVNGLHI